MSDCRNRTALLMSFSPMPMDNVGPSNSNALHLKSRSGGTDMRHTARQELSTSGLSGLIGGRNKKPLSRPFSQRHTRSCSSTRWCPPHVYDCAGPFPAILHKNGNRQIKSLPRSTDGLDGWAMGPHSLDVCMRYISTSRLPSCILCVRLWRQVLGSCKL